MRVKTFTKLIGTAVVAVVLAGCLADNDDPDNGIDNSSASGPVDTRWYTDNLYVRNHTISTADELAGLAQIVNGTASGIERDDFTGKIITLAKNIDLSAHAAREGWVPIGNYVSSSDNAPFSGVFDGDGYVISGLTIKRSADYQGLFGYIDDGKVENLGLEGVNINGGAYVGALAGYQTRGLIKNCYSTGTVSGTRRVGGLVGVTTSPSVITVSNCYSTAMVTGTGNSIGGVIGMIGSWGTYGGRAENLYATGVVEGADWVGGVVGDVETFCGIYNNAGLNPQVKGTGTRVGRVVGGFGTMAASRNGVAYSDMIARNDLQIGLDRRDGEDITAAQIRADGSIGERFTEENGWTVENGKLPGLNGKTVNMPAYLAR